MLVIYISLVICIYAFTCYKCFKLFHYQKQESSDSDLEVLIVT